MTTRRVLNRGRVRGDPASFRVLLLSTYELGRQPFGLASPAAWLRNAGFSVSTSDLAVERLDEDVVRHADLVALYVPMHTASRLATTVARRVRSLNADAELCFYGLYAPVNETFFRSLGAAAVLGGEFEAGLVALAERLADDGRAGPQQEPVVSLARQAFVVPDRSDLPPLDRYASLVASDGELRVVGYTEASRGCRHLCRHCPIVPVYGGRFRVVERDVVLEDIARQVEGGAQHITFGDPDFFNGPGHALPLVEELHRRFPELTYDVTIKVEHLVRHRDKLAMLKRTGCAFVTSAVESIDDRILEIFDKRHSRDDLAIVVRTLRELELPLSPTFVTFTPWTTLHGYVELLETILDLDLVLNVSPIQYAIRLLIPAESRLLELEEVREFVDPFDAERLIYPWTHPDPRVDRLYADVLAHVEAADGTRAEIFEGVWRIAAEAHEESVESRLAVARLTRTLPRAAIPHLNEPWYC